MIYVDTETLGLTSPLLSIQYAVDDGKPQFHAIWQNSVHSTLALIEALCSRKVVAWNLVFDWFHLTKWYNIFMQYAKEYGTHRFPDPAKAWSIEQATPRQYCLRPTGAIDLMIIARKGLFQHLMKFKPVCIRRVPELVADDLITLIEENFNFEGLRGVKIKWSKSKTDKRPGVVDLKAQFLGSTSLKYIHRIVTGEKSTGFWSDHAEIIEFGKAYKPWGGYWQEAVKRPFTEAQIAYALKDIRMLQELYPVLVTDNNATDIDSELTILVGGARWKGYKIDPQLAQERMPVPDMNVPHAPAAIQIYMQNVMNPIEQLAMVDNGKVTTKKEILQRIEQWGDHPAAQRAKAIRKKRKDMHYADLLHKLISVGSFHPELKVSGTLSNRMAGGASETTGRKGGSINPQGIDKIKWMREIFPLAYEDEMLSGGDFKAFEISIMDAVWKDPALHQELLLGKKMIALFGVKIYPELTYEQIIATDKEGEGSKYDRAKKGFYARAYGGQIPKLATVFGLTPEITALRLKSFDDYYLEIGKHYEKLTEEFTFFDECYRWKQPREYAETIFGYKRSFRLEQTFAKALYNAMHTLPQKWEAFRVEVCRHDKVQTVSNACRSALCGAIYSLQGRIIRVAGNFEIQAPGAELNKLLQHAIWSLQPKGVNHWFVRPMNVHDEQQVAHKPEYASLTKDIVGRFVEQMRDKVPLLGVEWISGMKNWSEK